MTESNDGDGEEEHYPAVLVVAKKSSEDKEKATARARKMRAILSRDSALTMYEIGESEVLDSNEYENILTEAVKES
jgi:hypothetical protein